MYHCFNYYSGGGHFKTVANWLYPEIYLQISSSWPRADISQIRNSAICMDPGQQCPLVVVTSGTCRTHLQGLVLTKLVWIGVLCIILDITI